jgi:hypothetical protein
MVMQRETFSSKQHYDYLVANFLTGVTSHVKKYIVDIMWLTDAHFVAGEKTTYIPHIQK